MLPFRRCLLSMFAATLVVACSTPAPLDSAAASAEVFTSAKTEEVSKNEVYVTQAEAPQAVAQSATESQPVMADQLSVATKQATLARASAATAKRLANPAPHPTIQSASGNVASFAVASSSTVNVQLGLDKDDTEKYAQVVRNPVQRTSENPVSTFSIDVDTGSYSNARRMLNEGRLPPTDAVRPEEFINYFKYNDTPSHDLDAPFAVSTELAPNPWNAKTKLLRISVKGYIPKTPNPPSNLVFLVDVSGSMNQENKLPLVQKSLKMLARKLSAQDRISLVTYAGATSVVLESTPGNQTEKILQAIDNLNASGGTNGGAGIQLAYQQAQDGFIKSGNNRILLATDGDFNVGISRFETLLDMVKDKRKSGVALTTLGYGGGNYNDQLMEQLADAGDGNYAYIDSFPEAQKVLVEERDAVLLTVAKDVKIQMEFNPNVVSEYRLIGYENRALKREDFSNDAIDAGEIGAGQSSTALYEVALVGQGGERIEPLRYSKPAAIQANGDELGFVRLRFKKPGEPTSKLLQTPVRLHEQKNRLADASNSFRLAAAVAAFAQKLSGDTYTSGMSFDEIAELSKSKDEDYLADSMAEFRQMVRLARDLSAKQPRDKLQIAE